MTVQREGMMADSGERGGKLKWELSQTLRPEGG